MTTKTAPRQSSDGQKKNDNGHHHPIPVFENSPTFQMACRQLDAVAAVIDVDPGILERLAKPKRAMVVSIPIRMDSDGRTENFIGYRVQHSLTSGPSRVDCATIRASIWAKWPPWPCGCPGSAAS
jgi:glutamate dehydrogenase (NAD(P)+)